MIKGKGSFSDYLKYVPRVVGAASGLMSQGASGVLSGWKEGAGWSKAMGLGAYGVTQNSLSTVSPVPVMHSTNESFRITNREFLADIAGTSTFTNTAYAINPGLSSAFPWLSAIAKNFQQYRINGLIYYYRATSSFTNPSGGSVALGTVMMSADYNSTDQPFTSKPLMEASMWTVSGAPCADAIFPLECKRNLTTINEMYVRSSVVPTGNDPHFYDFASFQIATAGCPSTATIGELWVSYDIELLKPIRTIDSGVSALSAHLIGTGSSTTVMFSNQTKVYDSIGITPALNYIEFPSNVTGDFLISYRCTGGTVSTLLVPVVGTCVACSVLNRFWNGDSPATYTNVTQSPATGGAGPWLEWQMVVHIPTAGFSPRFVLTADGYAQNHYWNETIITQLNSAYQAPKPTVYVDSHPALLLSDPKIDEIAKPVVSEPSRQFALPTLDSDDEKVDDAIMIQQAQMMQREQNLPSAALSVKAISQKFTR